jgi:hypothetical protein
MRSTHNPQKKCGDKNISNFYMSAWKYIFLNLDIAGFLPSNGTSLKVHPDVNVEPCVTKSDLNEHSFVPPCPGDVRPFDLKIPIQ